MDIELFHNEWISLRKHVDPKKHIKGYIYSTETRCNGKIIAVMPFRRVMVIPEAMKDLSKRIGQNLGQVRTEYLMRLEPTPCWGITNDPPDAIYRYLSTITGGVEGDTGETVVHELEEEAGYKVNAKNLVSLGTCFGSKSSNSVYSLFTIDLTDIIQGEATTDGSALEKASESIWVREDEIYDSKDPLASVLFMRAKKHLELP